MSLVLYTLKLIESILVHNALVTVVHQVPQSRPNIETKKQSKEDCVCAKSGHIQNTVKMKL